MINLFDIRLCTVFKKLFYWQSISDSENRSICKKRSLALEKSRWHTYSAVIIQKKHPQPQKKNFVFHSGTHGTVFTSTREKQFALKYDAPLKVSVICHVSSTERII